VETYKSCVESRRYKSCLYSNADRYNTAQLKKSKGGKKKRVPGRGKIAPTSPIDPNSNAFKPPVYDTGRT
jgi:hypothetical protein